MRRVTSELGPRVRGVGRVWAIGGAFLTSGLLCATSWSQSITWLGTLPGGGDSWATGVSADGSVVIGVAVNASSKPRAFRWTAAGGMQDLETLGGSSSEAYGLSADGSVVVGQALNASGSWRAFRWTEGGGMQDLGTLPGYEHGITASGVSADGSVVVGKAQETNGYERAFHWTAQTGMQDLGTLPGGDSSTASGVSADGAVVVGGGRNVIYEACAFRWTVAGGMQNLGTLPGGIGSHANAVSADGLVVVGVALNASGVERAFRWTADGGMQDLGDLGWGWSKAFGVSADGSVVVGYALYYTDDPAHSGYYLHAFRWTAEDGMQDLNQLYAALLQNGFYLERATAISPNGRYIVGMGRDPATGRRQAYLLDTAAAVGSFRILKVTPGNGRLTIEWEARSGAKYQLQAADAVSGPWRDVGPGIIASGPTASYTDNVSGVRQRFYRVLAR